MNTNKSHPLTDQEISEKIRDSIANAASLRPDARQKQERVEALKRIAGHPLHTLNLENEALTRIISQGLLTSIEEGDLLDCLRDIRGLSVHYDKKGDLLYPHLKVKYEISGPSDLMWTDDDEIRDKLRKLLKERTKKEVLPDPEWQTRAKALLEEIAEMIRKENLSLFSICAVFFTEEDWMQIYEDSKDYGTCFGVEPAVWEEAESYMADRREGKALSLSDPGPRQSDEIIMPGGHMTPAQLTALLNTIPMEITFVDDENINRYFNEGPKVFKRPSMAIDRDVFSCHPPKIEPIVRSIIEDFRNGRRDAVPIWMEKEGSPYLVTYMAIRDDRGNYLGTAEFVQDMTKAKDHFCH